MKLYCFIFVSFLLSSSLAFSEEDGALEEEKTEQEADTKVAPPRVGHIDLEKHTQMALVEGLRKNEAIWLDVEYPLPEGSQASEPLKAQVLALQRPSQKAHKHGAVLLVPGTGQHADWPEVIRPLRSELPESGWLTFSLSLPATSTEQFPERKLSPKQYDELVLSDALKDAINRKGAPKSTTDEEIDGIEEGSPEETEEASQTEEEELASEETGAEDESVDDNASGGSEDDGPVDIDLADKQNEIKEIPYQDKVLTHVNAGMKHLQQQGYQNIILLAYRSSVNVALQYLKQQQGMISDKGFAAVLVDPVFEEDNQLDLSEILGNNFQAPILEIVNSEEDKQTVKARLASAKVSGASRYMQVDHAFRSSGMQKSLTRRIRFWLEKYAPGMIRP
jgi:hypothetical protein